MIGRMTKAPDIRYSGADNSMCVARGSLAINRRYAKEGEQQADFPNIIAFGKTAEFFEKYVKKGTKLVIEGRLQTGSYTNKDNVKVYTTDIVVENVEFAESKASAEQTEPTQTAEGGFIPITEEVENEALPFV